MNALAMLCASAGTGLAAVRLTGTSFSYGELGYIRFMVGLTAAGTFWLLFAAVYVGWLVTIRSRRRETRPAASVGGA